MKLTKKSNKMLSFFLEFDKQKCIDHLSISGKTEDIFKVLYHEIIDAEKELNRLKKTGELVYNIDVKEIETVNQIVRPSTFPSDGFPEAVRNHIDEHTLSQITYYFVLFHRKITIHFLTEDINPQLMIQKYDSYVDHMILWLIIINEYASKNCATELIIYLYFTCLEKKMPETNITILDEYNVNTAFTMTCPKNSEIVIFRKEEWFKVFIHETFHNLSLDFSDMNNETCNKRILSLFPVKSAVNLYEAYAEFWAKIMNVSFCSYNSVKGNGTHALEKREGVKQKKNELEFLNHCEFLLHFERMYSYFQMVKILDFMNLKYDDLYKEGKGYDSVRKTFYKEKTNVLSYYIITLILINNYPSFLKWCSTNNISLLQFKKTTSNQKSLCDFIEKKYKSASFLKNIKCMEKYLQHIKKTDSKRNDKEYVLDNLRMTLFELG